MSRNQQRSLLGFLYPLERSRNRFIDIDKFTFCEIRPKLTQEGSVISMVQVAQDRLQGLGGLLSIVKRDATARLKSVINVNALLIVLLTGTNGEQRGAQ